MSPRFSTLGKRRLSNFDGNGSISLNHAASHPSGAQATLAASMPLHSEPKRIRRTPRDTASGA